MFKIWKQHWYTLDNTGLHEYLSDVDSKELSLFILTSVKARVVPFNANEPERTLFDLCLQNGSVHTLWANDDPDRIAWISAIQRVAYAEIGGGIFGQRLSITMKSPKNQPIPSVLKKCVEYIRVHGMHSTGIFRLAGNKVAVTKLRDDFNTGEDVRFDASGGESVNNVASLMKQYLRDLPEPLIPFEYYDYFVHSTIVWNDRRADAEARARAKEDVVNALSTMLPEDNYLVLDYLCNFLYDVHLASASNSMPAPNLALIFYPNILRSNYLTGAEVLDDHRYAQVLCSLLIEHYPTCFVRRVEKARSSARPRLPAPLPPMSNSRSAAPQYPAPQKPLPQPPSNPDADKTKSGSDFTDFNYTDPSLLPSPHDTTYTETVLPPNNQKASLEYYNNGVTSFDPNAWNVYNNDDTDDENEYMNVTKVSGSYASGESNAAALAPDDAYYENYITVPEHTGDASNNAKSPGQEAKDSVAKTSSIPNGVDVPGDAALLHSQAVHSDMMVRDVSELVEIVKRFDVTDVEASGDWKSAFVLMQEAALAAFAKLEESKTGVSTPPNESYFN